MTAHGVHRVGAYALILALASCAGAPPVVRHYYPGDSAMWERLFSERSPMALPDGAPVGAVMPHHDLAILNISRFYRALGERVSPPVVVVVSPDHFERAGAYPLVPDRAAFSTPSGILVPDGDLAEALVERGAAEYRDDVWADEHGIYGHTPFVARFFPDARFLPIAIRPGTARASVLALAETLNDILPPGSLVLASVDFSHYQIRAVAAHHDAATRSSISNFDYDSLWWREVDSPESLAAVMRFCELRGARRAEYIEGSSTFDVSRDPESETTSHQYWAFTPGTPVPRRSASLFIPGAMRGARRLGLMDRWPWDRYRTAADPVVRDLERVAGKEARFMMGFDAYLFAAEPGETVARANGVGLRVRCQDARDPLRPPSGPGADDGLDILELDGDVAAPEALLKEALLGGYELALWRGDRGAILAVRPEPGADVLFVDLGVFLSPGEPVSGAVALLTWTAGRWVVDSYAYESQDGYPPAIHQFTE